MAGFQPVEWMVAYDLAEAAVIFLSILAVAILIRLFMKKIVSVFIMKTKTTLDDNLVKAIKRPVFLGMILFGAYMALKSISHLDLYQTTISRVCTVLAIILLFYLVHRVIDALVKWYSSEWSVRTRGKETKNLSIFGRIADILLLFVFGLVMMRYLGIDITPLLASLGIGGIAVALALQETLSNFFAGLSIIGDKSIKVGDYIALENEELAGYVDDISWRTSRIKTLSGDYIIVPNTKLSQSITKDYNFSSSVTSVGVTIFIGYNNDLDKVEKIVNKVAKDVQNSTEGAVKGFEPNMRFKEFQDNNIMATVYFKINSVTNKFLVRHEFIKRIKKEFDKNKIERSYPVRLVRIKKN